MTPLAYVGAREAAPIASWAMQTADIFAYLEARDDAEAEAADDFAEDEDGEENGKEGKGRASRDDDDDASARAFSFGVDPSEPHPPAQPGNAGDMQVFFLNLCQVTVNLKWVDPRREEEGGVGPEGLQIADVEPNTEHELATYVGHQFTMVYEGEKLRLYDVKEDVTRYVPY